MVHKTRTKALSWLLSLAMALSLLPGTAWATTGNNISISDEVKHGSVETTIDDESVTSAEPGATVTVTVTPDADYTVDSVSYSYPVRVKSEVVSITGATNNSDKFTATAYTGWGNPCLNDTNPLIVTAKDDTTQIAWMVITARSDIYFSSYITGYTPSKGFAYWGEGTGNLTIDGINSDTVSVGSSGAFYLSTVTVYYYDDTAEPQTHTLSLLEPERYPDYGAPRTATLTMPPADVTLSVTLVENPTYRSFEAITGSGTITKDGDLRPGHTVTLGVKPDLGYALAEDSLEAYWLYPSAEGRTDYVFSFTEAMEYVAMCGNAYYSGYDNQDIAKFFDNAENPTKYIFYRYSYDDYSWHYDGDTTVEGATRYTSDELENIDWVAYESNSWNGRYVFVPADLEEKYHIYSFDEVKSIVEQSTPIESEEMYVNYATIHGFNGYPDYRYYRYDANSQKWDYYTIAYDGDWNPSWEMMTDLSELETLLSECQYWHIADHSISDNVYTVQPLGYGLSDNEISLEKGTDGTYSFSVPSRPRYSSMQVLVVAKFETDDSSTAPVISSNDDYDPPVTVSATNDTDSVAVSATVSGSTASVSTPSATQLEQIVSESARDGGVTFDVSGLNRKIETVSLPAATVRAVEQAVSTAASETAGLTVKLSGGSVSFDAQALTAITEQTSGSNLSLSLQDIGENRLNSAQRSAASDMDVQAVYDAYMTSNGKRISDFKGGRATVAIPYALKAGQSRNGIAVWYIADDGSKTEMPSVYDGKDVRFTVEHFSNYAVVYDAQRAAACPRDDSCPMSSFTDLNPALWYHDGVHFCLENGLMKGVGNDKFNPGGTTSRGMIVTILYRLEGEPKVTAENPFTDVEDGQWYADAVIWAAENDIVSGYGGGKFGPNDSITREQLATILYRYAQSKGQGFEGSWMFLLDYPDASEVSSWADEAMHWMVMNGIINGKDGKLVPGGNASRAEAATMLQRFCENVAE